MVHAPVTSMPRREPAGSEYWLHCPYWGNTTIIPTKGGTHLLFCSLSTCSNRNVYRRCRYLLISQSVTWSLLSALILTFFASIYFLDRSSPSTLCMNASFSNSLAASRRLPRHLCRKPSLLRTSHMRRCCSQRSWAA